LSVIQHNPYPMAKIVADLKQVARMHQPAAAARTAVDLNEVVQHVCRVQEYRLRTSNVEIVTRLGSALPPVAAERAELEQVLINLVVNACQAMSEQGGGRLTLTTTRAVRGALLQVTDTGPGIAAEHLERVFDPFFTTKAPGDGTGLGLAVVHGIVSENGGQIRIDSVVGQGTTVLVEWPAASRSAPMATRDTAT
jgi:C4-dicarboxylate-specific signal transduction histidine kinase